MGKSTFLTGSIPTDARKPQRKNLLLRLQVDMVLLVAVIFLIVIGILMVYSSSWLFSLWNDRPTSYIPLRQMIFIAAGSVAVLVLSRFDYHWFQRLALPMMITALLLLVAVLFIGDLRFSATRTLFNGSIQPSELSKLVIIIYLSIWLYSKGSRLNSVTIGLLPMILILGITAGLIFLQPDLSAAATIFILGGLMFYFAGGDIRQILLVVIISLIVGASVFSAHPTGQKRITEYWEGTQSIENLNYHTQLSFAAIIRGGFFGVGIGNGQGKFSGLPVPWTDSIFAVIVEEIGLIGAVFVIILYMVFMWRGFLIAQQAPDQLGRLLASGMTAWIAFEALVNMAVMVQLIPFAGNALPLISYGGSNMVTILLAIGVIMSVSHTGNTNKDSPERKKYGAIVDLRWWNRRRSVSRSDRSKGAGS